MDKKKLILIACLSQTVIVGLIPLLKFYSDLNIYTIYLLGFMLSAMGSLFSVSNESLVPELVVKKDLVEVNSLYQLLSTSSRLIGPMMAGLLISIFNEYIALLIDSISFIPLFVTVLLFMKNEDEKKLLNCNNESISLKHIFADTKESFKFVCNHNVILPIIVLSFSVNLSNGIVEAMFIFLAKDVLKYNSTMIGIIFSLAAIVQIIAAVVTPHIISKFEEKTILSNSQILNALGIAFVAIFAKWWLVSIGKALIEGPSITYNILSRSVRQSVVPSEMLGRVNGINRTIALATFPIAGFLGGVLSDYIGVKAVIGGASILLVLVVFSLKFTLFSNFNPKMKKLKNDSKIEAI